MRLADLAPRLARARDQWVAFDNARLEAVSRQRDTILRLEWLVAHRELQEVRAMAKTARPGGRAQRRSAGNYLSLRQRKLEDARKALEDARKRLRRLERPS